MDRPRYGHRLILIIAAARLQLGGYLAGRMVNKTGEGMVRDIILGIVGGVIFRVLGGHGVTGFNLWSILVAFIGVVVVLLIYVSAAASVELMPQ